MPATTFDPDAYLASKQAKADVPAGGFDPNSYLQAKGVALNEPVAQTVTGPSTEIPRPDATSGPTYRMDPFARTGYLMGTPQGKQAMQQTAQVVKNLGLEGGGAALGQLAGAPLAEFGGVQVGGALGAMAGNAAKQLTSSEPFSFGQMLAAAPGGVVLGGPLAKAGAKELITQGAKYAAANLAGVNIGSMVDTGKPASFGQDAMAVGSGIAAPVLGKVLDQGASAEAARIAAGNDSVRRETLAAGRKIGLTVPPAVTRPGPINNTIQSIGGKAAVAQETILRNQPKVNAAIRAEIGLPPDAPLSPIALNTARTGPNLVYDEVAKLTPATGQLLENFKTATADANMARQAYRDSIDAGRRNPALLEQAQAHDAIAEQMRNAIAKEANSPGANTRNADDIMKRFDAARTKLAQIGLAERAVNKGSGDIDPAVIGQALEHGEKLSGAFSTIGRFENAFGRYLKDAATTPPSGVDYLKFIGRLGVGGGLGYTLGGYPGMLAGGAIAHGAESAARRLAVSPTYQQAFANPFYGSTAPDFATQLAKFSALSAGRSKPADVGDEPLSESELALLEELKARQ